MISLSLPAVIVLQWRQVFIIQWQNPTSSHYEGQGKKVERKGGERERAGYSDKFPFVYAQGGKRQTVCGGWRITWVAPQVLSCGPEAFLWLARSALPLHSFILYGHPLPCLSLTHTQLLWKVIRKKDTMYCKLIIAPTNVDTFIDSTHCSSVTGVSQVMGKVMARSFSMMI